MDEIEIQEHINKLLNAAIKKGYNKDFKSAIIDLKSALLLDENNPLILYNIGVFYSRLEIYKTAVEYFQKVLNLPFTFVDAMVVRKLLAFSMIKTGDFNSALKYIEECLTVSTDDTSAMNIKGYCLLHSNRSEEAINLYKKVLIIDSQDYNAYNSLAYILQETDGDINLALKYAKIALDSNPENPAYLDTIACIYMKKGQNDIAKNYFKKALNIKPDSEEIKNNINKLLKIKKM
jgi:tetratricopeptide (TPR) repeat protein